MKIEKEKEKITKLKNSNLIKIKIPATSANLGPFFDIGGVALDFYNVVECEFKSNSRNIFKFINSDEVDLPLCQNLFLKVFFKFLKREGLPLKGYSINFYNNIPFKRGLGSSSAAICGALVLANIYLKNKYSLKELAKKALEFESHPDNLYPAFFGGMIFNYKKETDFSFFKIADLPFRFSVIIPDFEISTEKARAILPEKYSLKDIVFNMEKISLFLNSIYCRDYNGLKLALDDIIHQPYRSKLFRENLFVDIKDYLKNQHLDDYLGTTISGSGPSLLIWLKKEININFFKNILKKYLDTKKIKFKILFPDIQNKGVFLDS